MQNNILIAVVGVCLVVIAVLVTVLVMGNGGGGGDDGALTQASEQAEAVLITPTIQPVIQPVAVTPKPVARTTQPEVVKREKYFVSDSVKSRQFNETYRTDHWKIEPTPGFIIYPDTAQFEVQFITRDKGCSGKRSSSKWITRTVKLLEVEVITAAGRRYGRSCWSKTTVSYREILL